MHRKHDHINLSLQAQNQASFTPSGHHSDHKNQAAGWAEVQLRHEALPNLNFEQLKLEHNFCNMTQQKPLLVSCMTGGLAQGEKINFQLAELATQHGWLMGLGSQRHELEKQVSQQHSPSQQLRQQFKNLKLLANIGLAQLIQYGPQRVSQLAEKIEASALVVHTNPLQECLQPEGTPQFYGGLRALEQLCRHLGRPVVLKETGCGFSTPTLKSLKGCGLKAVDISGYGGTHWGRIEGHRAQQVVQQGAAQTFAHWGVPTAQVLQQARALNLDYELWASGGVRSGLDAAKGFALGAQCAGFAQPLLKALLQNGPEGLDNRMQQIEFELKLALFCTGSSSIKSLANALV